MSEGGITPQLSVVVPSVNGWSDLSQCLEALQRESVSVPLEVLVPERCGAPVREAVIRNYPLVQLLPVPPETTIPEMRARAFAAATASTVAVIEDHVLVPAGWAHKILEARRNGQRVIGGIVHNAATERIVDWAAFFCEYSQLAAPLRSGPADWLTGNNTAYDRALLDEFREVMAGGQWENVLHEALRKSGVTLWCRPDLIAAHRKHYTVREYLAQRFLSARAYAGMRLRSAGPLHRFGYGLLALGLPPLLFTRIVSRVWRGGAHRRELLLSVPLLALFVSAWGLGDLAGAWWGEGDALARVT
ncbi:MAG TPA: hypothetical protein VGQ73_03710 [Gemmatimonadales bacterium]|jgi:hypothetical protein|nr:hypothetical protein [Gemmatimonadales bacterium]